MNKSFRGWMSRDLDRLFISFVSNVCKNLFAMSTKYLIRPWHVVRPNNIMSYVIVLSVYSYYLIGVHGFCLCLMQLHDCYNSINVMLRPVVILWSVALMVAATVTEMVPCYDVKTRCTHRYKELHLWLQKSTATSEPYIHRVINSYKVL